MFLIKLLCGLVLGYFSMGQNYVEYVEDLGQGNLGAGVSRVLTLCNGNPCYVYNKNGDFTYAHCGDRHCSPANKTETVIMANACGHNSCPATICRSGYPPVFFTYYGKYLIIIFSSHLRGRVYYVRCEDEICRNHTNPKVVVPTHVAEVECAFLDYHEIVISTSTLSNFGKLLRCDADDDCSTLLNYFTLSPPFSFKKIGLVTYGSYRTDIIEVFLDYQSRLFILMCDGAIGGFCIPYLIDTGVPDNYFAVEERDDIIMVVYFKLENGLWHLKLAICTNPNRMACGHLEIQYITNYNGGVIGSLSIIYNDSYSYNWIGGILISYVADNKLQLIDCDRNYCTESDIQTREDSLFTRRTSGIYELRYENTDSWYVLYGNVNNRLSLYIRTEVPIPTASPSPKPTRYPTMTSSSPTKNPTIPPTKSPTNMPSLFPTIQSQSPTLWPTVVPTDAPAKIMTVFQDENKEQSAESKGSIGVAWSLVGLFLLFDAMYGMYKWGGWSQWKCWQHKCWKKCRCRCFKQVETRYLESEPNIENKN